MYMYFAFLPFVYIMYLTVSPVVDPLVTYAFYKIKSNVLRPKKITVCDFTKKVLVYSSNEKSKKRIIEKIQQEPMSKEFIFLEPKEPKDMEIVEEDEDIVVVVSTDMETFVSSCINKIQLDYVIIDCNKHIVFKENVFEEFFKYTGIDREKFFKLYNDNESIILDMRQNNISTFM